MQKEILELLAEGLSYREIERRLGCARSTISYNATKIGYKSVFCKPEKIFDFDKLQEFYNEGKSVKECCKTFNIGAARWYAEVAKGNLKLRNRERTNLNDVMIESSGFSRRSLKKRILRDAMNRSGTINR